MTDELTIPMNPRHVADACLRTINGIDADRMKKLAEYVEAYRQGLYDWNFLFRRTEERRAALVDAYKTRTQKSDRITRIYRDQRRACNMIGFAALYIVRAAEAAGTDPATMHVPLSVFNYFKHDACVAVKAGACKNEQEKAKEP